MLFRDNVYNNLKFKQFKTVVIYLFIKLFVCVCFYRHSSYLRMSTDYAGLNECLL